MSIYFQFSNLDSCLSLTLFPPVQMGRLYIPCHIFSSLSVFFWGKVQGEGCTFDLIRKFWMFFCLLNAVRGGSGNTSFKYEFWVIIDLQCFASIGCTAGILGSNCSAKIGRFSLFLAFTFNRAIFLGIFTAFFIDLSIRDSG